MKPTSEEVRRLERTLKHAKGAGLNVPDASKYNLTKRQVRDMKSNFEDKLQQQAMEMSMAARKRRET